MVSAATILAFKKPQTAHDEPFVERPHFDILTGPTRVEAALEQMAAIRTKMSPEELGTMAGVGVLDQFRVAKAETNVRWWKDPGLALAGLYSAISVTAPAVSLGAAAALDVAIFGGAAHDLMKVNPLYSALAVGSLVFAIGIGIAKNHKNLLVGFMMAASAGAAVLGADDPAFIKHFATMLPNSINTTTNAAASTTNIAQADVNHLKETLKQHQDQLNHGGVGGKPMLADGFKGNDEQANQLIKITIPKDEADIRAAEKQWAIASSQQSVADKEDPGKFIGRLLGAAYLFTWLAASQLVAANVLRVGPDIFKKQKQRSSEFKTKKSFVRELEKSKPEKSRQLAEASVSDMLMRFNRILTVAGSGGTTRITNVEHLFEGPSLARMQKIGTDLVVQTLPQRRSLREFLSDTLGRPAAAPAP